MNVRQSFQTAQRLSLTIPVIRTWLLLVTTMLAKDSVSGDQSWLSAASPVNPSLAKTEEPSIPFRNDLLSLDTALRTWAAPGLKKWTLVQKEAPTQPGWQRRRKRASWRSPVLTALLRTHPASPSGRCRGHLHQRCPKLGGRWKRQVGKASQGTRSSTPSNMEYEQPSSQYPWAIIWGPTVSEEITPDTSITVDRADSLVSQHSHGSVTSFPNVDSSLQDNGLILGETPSTLQPVLLGPRTEGVDPQLYVTISISVLIVLAATTIILKFCWDRNQKRRRNTDRQNSLQPEESRQPLTDVSPNSGTFFGLYSDMQKPMPESESLMLPELIEKRDAAMKNNMFQRNRIPVVNL
ncbi:PILR alpha-associated neural protein [Protopterus annectens]|uniref:PILR alpha-associated neural protein n=1 Tax=Protopterus annectens TaxID=7888 RepID=UPI001CFBADED|nr:PILR alpha-associated neural protein [Protopterus annectens]